MSTIRQSLYVEFNEHTSDEFGIISVNMSSGLQSENVFGERSLVKTKVSGRNRQYLHRVDEDVFKFTLQLAFEDEFTDQMLADVIVWLRTSDFSPMVFSERENIIYYAICVGTPVLYHTTANQGYIEANFECDSNSMYSDYISTKFDLSSNGVSGTVITVENNGHEDIQMDFDITAVGNTNVSIVSLSNGGEEFKLTGMLDGENVQFTSENELLESTESGNRFDIWNETNITLKVGKNRLLVKGTCQLKLIYQYIMFAD